jgi:hypothetical protein
MRDEYISFRWLVDSFSQFYFTINREEIFYFSNKKCRICGFWRFANAYFYLHFNEVAWPKFNIQNWDAGWWQIKQALNDVGLAQELLEELYVVHKELGDEIKPLIYKYQFLEPDMRDVNA